MKSTNKQLIYKAQHETQKYFVQRTNYFLTSGFSPL